MPDASSDYLHRLIVELGQARFMSVDVPTRHKELYIAKFVQFMRLMRCENQA